MLNIQPGITAIIGAGGKSTLLRTLAQELSAHARVVVATSTKMHVPDWCCVVLDEEGIDLPSTFRQGADDEHETHGEASEGCESRESGDRAAGGMRAKGGACVEGVNGGAAGEGGDVHAGDAALLAAVRRALVAYPCVCVGSIHKESGKLQAPHLEFSRLADVADYVLVEADGAHKLPLKAHASYEPVIPTGTVRTVCVVGADGFGAPVSQVCHRPQRFAELAGVSVDAAVAPEAVAAVLNAEAFHDVVLVNKVETAEAWLVAQRLAALCETPVVAGSLWEGVFRCL